MIDKGFVMREGENAFERTVEVLDLIDKFPDQISNEELKGVVKYVNPDLKNTVLGLFELESARSTEIFFFKKLLHVLKEAQAAQENGKKVVFIPFTFPPEIIYAFENLFPVCTEIVGGLAVNICAGQGERFWDYAMGMGLPDSLCSANTIPVGSLCMGPTLTPDAIVCNASGSCNPNAKMHAFAADYLGIPQFIWDKPVEESARGHNQYIQYFKALIGELEEFAGEELSEQRMREVLQRSCRAVDLYNELWALKRVRPCPVPNIFDVDFAATRGQLWGREEAVEILQKMVDAAKKGLQKGEGSSQEEVARVFISYIHFLFDFHGFFSWMQRKGISVCGSILFEQFFPPIDMSSKESMMEGMAETAWNMPMTRQMGSDSMSVHWLEDIIYAVEDLGADACIYCGHHACKHTEGIIAFFRREMMKQFKVPTLVLKGDAFDKRNLPTSMIQDEIEQFVGQIVSKKKAPKRRLAKKAAANPKKT